MGGESRNSLLTCSICFSALVARAGYAVLGQGGRDTAAVPGQTLVLQDAAIQ